MMRRFFPVLFALVTIVGSLYSQVSTKVAITEGRRYVVAFPQVWASNSEEPLPNAQQIFVSSKYDTKVTVRTVALSNDQTGINKTYKIRKNSAVKIPISINYMNNESENIKGYGIEVIGEKPVTVYTYQAWTGNGEMARHLPVSSWGKMYYTMNFFLDRYGDQEKKYRPSQTLIIAAYDNTNITYTPVVTTEGGVTVPETPAGRTTTVTLNRGETFLIRSKVIESELKEFTSDFSGTRITSNRPFGVVSGHTKVAIMRYPDILPPDPNLPHAEAHFVRNNVHDAMLPVEMAGTEFICVPTMYTPRRTVGNLSGTGAGIGIDDDKGDVIRFNAIEDNTTISYLRSDGTKANLRRLNRGQSYIVPSMETATMYVSDKPMLVGQYGKSWANVTPPVGIISKGDNPQGHPTVEAGMPMLEYVPSINRWVDYGLFTSPEGMDNFVNVVFNINDIGKIKIDGRPLNAVFGGAMRPINGTPYAHVRGPIASGDHVITSDSGSNVKWAAWAYGSLDGMQMGRAYGTAIASNFSNECHDSVWVEENRICGSMNGTINLSSNSSWCVGLFDVFLNNEVNCTLTYDEDINPSEYGMRVPFQVTVTDQTKMARATLIVITKGGTQFTYEFTYSPNLISLSTVAIDFGTVAKGETVCKQVTMKNVGTTIVSVLDVVAKLNKSLITVTPNKFVLLPSDSVVLSVCLSAKFNGGLVDTLSVVYSDSKGNICYTEDSITIVARVDEPDFYASDRDWGIIGKNQKLTKQVVLTNLSNADVEVYDYSPKLTGPYFSNLRLTGGDTTFPITIKKGDRINVDIDYTPNGVIGVSHTQRIDWSTNATKTKLYSDLKGQGADAALEITSANWTERVIDQWQLNQGINQYLDTVYITNVGLRAANINSIKLVGQDVASFKIIDTSGVPRTMTGKMANIPVVVAFVPTEVVGSRNAERTYDCQLTIDFVVDSENGSVSGELQGTALQPRVSASGHDYGQIQVGSISVATIDVSNVDSTLTNVLSGNTDGTMTMELYELTIPAAYPFVWTRNNQKTITYTPGQMITPGDGNKWSEPVTFAPTTVGNWSVAYTVKYNGHIVVKPILEGSAIQTTEINVFDNKSINWFSRPIQDSFKFTLTTDGLVEVLDPIGNDPLEFRLLGWTANGSTLNTNLNQIPVTKNVEYWVHYEFIPSAVTAAGLTAGQNLNNRLPFRTNSFTSLVEVHDLVSGLRDTANLTGDGKYLETTVYVPDYKDIVLGQTFDVYAYLKNVPQDVDSGYIDQFRTRLTFNPMLMSPISVIQSGTLTDGWRIVSYQVIGKNMIELDLKNDNKIPLNNSKLPIYGVKFQSLLTAEKSCPLPVELYWVDLEQNTIDNKQYTVFNYEPGSVTVTAPCAGILRVIGVGSKYYIKLNGSNVSSSLDVEYGVGITAPVEMYLVNVTGEVVTLVSASQSQGQYNFRADLSTLTSGVYYLIYKSVDYVASPIKIIKQ